MTISWYTAPIKDEASEFDRVTTLFSITHRNGASLERNLVDLHWDFRFKEIQKEYLKQGTMRLLTSVWSRLDNTDSYGTTSEDKIKKAIKQNKKSSGDRSLEQITKEFASGRVRMPIIIKTMGDHFHLVAGNTRLMYCRWKNIVPEVIVLKLNW